MIHDSYCVSNIECLVLLGSAESVVFGFDGFRLFSILKINFSMETISFTVVRFCLRQRHIELVDFSVKFHIFVLEINDLIVQGLVVILLSTNRFV